MATNVDSAGGPVEPRPDDDTPSTSNQRESSQPAEWWFYCDRLSCSRKVPRHEGRYNCEQCHDFDYCERCIPDASLIHPGHTFVKVDPPEPLPELDRGASTSPELKADAGAQDFDCCSCRPVTRALPLLQFVMHQNSQHKRFCVKWPVRISCLIEAAQLGCAFCCFFLHAFFRSSNFESHYYTEERPWYTQPREHDKERMELVEHCMGTLTRLKTDRFDFEVSPISSRLRKGVKLWDFEKLKFELANSNAKMHGKEDLAPGNVFHSAGVISMERYVFAAKNDPASQHLSSRPPNPSPASPESIEQIKAWLRGCDLHHGATCRPSPTGTLPSRVIDVSDPTTLRLHETTASDTHPLHYATLSYCWGGLQSFETTISTLHSRQQGFPLTSLPATLQDAVRLTQSLSIPYLWIDSLCIIQDSSEDKFRELARMSDIYKHSTLTIIASRAGSASEGFFADRADPDTKMWKALVPVGYYLPNAEAKTIEEGAKMPKQAKGTVYLLDEPASMSGTVKDPVADRAWCLQERVLSPRVVSYGRWPTWRCNRIVGSDGGFVNGEGAGERRLTQALVRSDEKGKGDGRLDHFRTAQLLATWRGVVQDYTRRKLSLPTDRLPAIAGIAREMARLTGMEYLAGLWRDNMLQELMWYARTQEWRTRPEHTDEFPLAPTWSWTSVEAPILCDAVTEDATPLARVLRCSVRGMEGKSTYEVVAGGEVEIQGPFRELRREDVVGLLRKQNYAPAPPLSNDVQEWYQQLLEDTATRPQTKVPIDDVEAELPGRVFGLMLFERDWIDDRWDKERPKVMEMCYFGLLLREVESGRYERIGAFCNETSEFLDLRVQPWGEARVVLV